MGTPLFIVLTAGQNIMKSPPSATTTTPAGALCPLGHLRGVVGMGAY